MLTLLVFVAPMFAEDSKPTSCDSLVKLHLAKTVISSATTVPAGAFAPPLNSIHYYERVLETVGKDTPDFVRLFLVPGMQHCQGGPGATSFDGVAALERWVEDGVAPERIIASHTANGVVERTRPLCPYPQAAVYKGKGSTTDAANFACKVSAQFTGEARPPSRPVHPDSAVAR
jgi:hypothetical protein